MKLERNDMEPYVWVAQSEDFPIAQQGGTPQEASDRLRDTLRDYLKVNEPVPKEADPDNFNKYVEPLLKMMGGPEPRYFPRTIEQVLGYFTEECGEVLSAIGKTQRWGLESVNPELDEPDQETNRDWILRELVDLEAAIKILRQRIEPGQ
jgi:NTP pyrophosphatase (non-canonical NTP hydrolase)/predicted RNase H-like HicB family nuclease